MKTPQALPMVRAPRASGSREMADACTVVIFGGSGDLTRRKLSVSKYRTTLTETPSGFMTKCQLHLELSIATIQSIVRTLSLTSLDSTDSQMEHSDISVL